MFLFDTDTLSNLMKSNPSARLLDRLTAVPLEQQFTSAITVGEMVYGAYRGAGREHHLQQLNEKVWPNLRILPFGQDAGEAYGRLRAELERTGTPLAEPDLRIAAIALTHGLTVVTGNTRHFSRVPGLRVENWL